MSEAMEAAPEAVEPIVEESAGSAEESNPEDSIESSEADIEASGEPAGEIPEGAASETEMEAAVEAIKKLELKVDGKTMIEELPFAVSPEQAEYLQKQLQLAKMSQSRAQEAAELRKKDLQRNQELQEFLDTLKNNPASILSQMGVDVNEFAEAVLSQEVEKMQLSPEERRIMELEEQLREIREQEEKAKKLAEEKEMEALRDKYAAEYEKNLLEAIEENGLPNTPYVVGKMVNMVATAQENGLDLNFKDVVGLVKEEYDTEVRSRISGFSADELISLLSEQMRQDIVAKSIKKPEVKKEAPPTGDQVQETGAKKSDYLEKKYRGIDAEDFFRNL